MGVKASPGTRAFVQSHSLHYPLQEPRSVGGTRFLDLIFRRSVYNPLLFYCIQFHHNHQIHFIDRYDDMRYLREAMIPMSARLLDHTLARIDQ